jgi:hypothetical protein
MIVQSHVIHKQPQIQSMMLLLIMHQQVDVQQRRLSHLYEVSQT